MSFLENETTISIHTVGERTGRAYPGEFKVRKFLSHRQLLLKDRLLREYLAGDNPQISSQVSRADQLSTIQASVVKGPEWWEESQQGMDLYDDNILLELYEGVRKVQKDAEEAVKAKAKAGIPATSETLKKAAE